MSRTFAATAPAATVTVQPSTGGSSRTAAARAWLETRVAGPMPRGAVVVASPSAAFQAPGGGEVQLVQTARHLEMLGWPIRPFVPWVDSLRSGQARLLHLFGMSPEGLSLARCARACGATGLPAVARLAQEPAARVRSDLAQLGGRGRSTGPPVRGRSEGDPRGAQRRRVAHGGPGPVSLNRADAGRLRALRWPDRAPEERARPGSRRAKGGPATGRHRRRGTRSGRLRPGVPSGRRKRCDLAAPHGP